MTVKSIFKIKTNNIKMATPSRQSIEATEDYAVKKVLNTLSGTVEKVPVNDNDLVNKAYVDSASGAATEGTDIKSTGIATGSYLGADGDGTSSWYAIDTGDVEGTDVLSTGEIAGKILTATGSDTSEWVTPEAGVTDHTLLSNIGDNTHDQIDSHIEDDTIHFTEASISIPASQVSDFDTEVSNNISVVANTAKISYTDAALVADHTIAIGSNTAKVSFDWDYDYTDLINKPTIVDWTNATEDWSNTGTFNLEVPDNTEQPFYIGQGAVGYICVNTENGDEYIQMGCAGVATPIFKIQPTVISLNKNTDVTGNITVTGTVDGVDVAGLKSDYDITAIAVGSNTAKVTNATHTGDVTGSEVLTIANGAVDIAMLSATGSASATTFLRGDNTWAIAGDVTSDAVNTLIKQSGHNAIRAAQDRAITLNNTGEFVEAYTDTTGQLDSVDTGSTTATFDTNEYGRAASGTTNTTPAVPASGGYSNGTSFSLTCSVDADGYFSRYNSNNGRDITSIVIKKNGSTVASKSPGDDVVTFTPSDYSSLLEDGDTMTVEVTLDSTYTRRYQAYSGTLFSYTSQLVFQSDNMVYTSYVNPTTVDIVHTVPTGTYSSTVSKVYGTALVNNTEEAATIQYKLTNATEDTGWLDINEYSSFTAFTSEPTQLTFRLTIGTAGTSNYPSIYGVSVTE